jgi:hypothetical protein
MRYHSLKMGWTFLDISGLMALFQSTSKPMQNAPSKPGRRVLLFGKYGRAGAALFLVRLDFGAVPIINAIDFFGAGQNAFSDPPINGGAGNVVPFG